MHDLATLAIVSPAGRERDDSNVSNLLEILLFFFRIKEFTINLSLNVIMLY